MGAIFVAGRAGSGKSRYIRDCILKEMKKGRVILLVPDQYTLEAERELIAHLEVPGLFGIEVLSFSRLIHRILSETGRPAESIDAQGKAMLVRRLLHENRDELKVYRRVSDSAGFAAMLSEALSEFKRADIEPDALMMNAAALPGRLGDKLYDAALIYGKYIKALSGRMESEDFINCAIDGMCDAEFINGAAVFIDGFDVLTAQMLRLIENLTVCSRSITISFLMETSPKAGDYTLFAPERLNYEKCMEAVMNAGITPQIITLPNEKYVMRSGGALRHMERNLYAYPAAQYDGEPYEIELYAMTDITSEVEFAAAGICDLAKKGARWRDIAVICNDMDTYGHIIERVFRECGIPCFTDRKYPVSGHAVVEFITAAIDAVHGYSRRDVLRVARTGYAGLNDNEAEMFENYCIKHGIKGSAFLRPFKKGEADVAEPLRKKLMPRLLELDAGLKKGEGAAALLNYAKSADIEQKLNAEIESIESAAQREVVAQVYEMLEDTLEQLKMADAAEGDARLLPAMLAAGLATKEIGIIPTAADEVMIGDISRTKLGNIKALIIIGASDGVLPRAYTDDGLFSDTEIRLLKERGLAAGKESSFLNAVERMQMYGALSRPSEKIIISYPVASGSEELQPSEIVGRLRKIFPRLELKKNMPLSEGMRRKLVCSEEMAVSLSAQKEWADVKAWLKKYRPELYAARFGKTLGSAASITPVAAKKLYGGAAIGVSRLEKYFACPFRQFVENGLKPQPREEFSLPPVDKGWLSHAALDGFTKKLLEKGALAEDISEEEALALADDMLDQALSEYREGMLFETAVLRNTALRIKRSIRAAVLSILKHMRMSDYKIAGSEMEFGMGDGPAPITAKMPDGSEVRLAGVIDRVDIAPDGRVRIADYKSGKVQFNLDEAYAGLQLQLLIYMRAALLMLSSGAKSVSPGGLHYMSLSYSFSIAKGVDMAAEKAAEAEFEKLPQISGLILEGGAAVGKEKKLPPDKLDAAIEYAVLKAEEAVRGIMSGDIAIRPVMARRDPCAYCGYAAICRIERRGGKKAGDGDIFASINGDKEDGDD
ncbi:MAG: PD-(D/E)XK nuclease family protein [Christensenellales bacterium]|jgi:ATP-dependent helicase/nuclease subunit B